MRPGRAISDETEENAYRNGLDLNLASPHLCGRVRETSPRANDLAPAHPKTPGTVSSRAQRSKKSLVLLGTQSVKSIDSRMLLTRYNEDELREAGVSTFLNLYT